ncbi:ABC transporter ATP-binding protein [Rubrimonas cliftonensis]|uniref:Carbohydrate ABC transporter ATP-binding protein, CUT1 family n=1 Tax=Rubrimonas cliftonensis TaxID=89524 RepID=A0A1H4C3H2_9RHOB|nr:ABC transporter ATP-binding protein [Rubrimonas cliftonensis]SEA54995.1 carbohydrate ABC transporter ATP-binding protein, CUT1 family [Rubrimonas cliftonensis]
MSAPALELDRVSKIYGAKAARPVRAVDAVSMSVAKGEIVALLGSSGCGKTSTLRMVAGFETVSEGAVRIAGREVNRVAPAKRNVAMAFEGYSLYPPLTVRENIAFALKSARLPREEVARRVAEIAHLLEIEPILDRYPASISGGQQQRASLGRALIREADLHLLDEPMGQLEPALRALLRGRIKHFVKERGLTAVLVTHDQTEANALADRIAVMEGGVLQQFASPAELKDRPANLFTGTFIGEPPMNVFQAQARAEGDALRLGLGEGVALDYPAAGFEPAVRETILKRGRVTLGVRPHAVRLDPAGAPAEVAANQWLGDQSHIAASFAGGTLVTVEHDRARLRPGDRIGVRFEPADLHVFDGETGAALSHGGRAA